MRDDRNERAEGEGISGVISLKWAILQVGEREAQERAETPPNPVDRAAGPQVPPPPPAQRPLRLSALRSAVTGPGGGGTLQTQGVLPGQSSTRDTW